MEQMKSLIDKIENLEAKQNLNQETEIIIQQEDLNNFESNSNQNTRGNANSKIHMDTANRFKNRENKYGGTDDETF